MKYSYITNNQNSKIICRVEFTLKWFQKQPIIIRHIYVSKFLYYVLRKLTHTLTLMHTHTSIDSHQWKRALLLKKLPNL